MRDDAKLAQQKLAMRKRADAYISRDGAPPSVLSRAKSGKHQDLNDDDFKHLKWCLKMMRAELLGARSAGGIAALEFVEAILTRDYALDRGERLRGEAPMRSEDDERFTQALQEEMSRVRPRSGESRKA